MDQTRNSDPDQPTSRRSRSGAIRQRVHKYRALCPLVRPTLFLLTTLHITGYYSLTMASASAIYCQFTGQVNHTINSMTSNTAIMAMVILITILHSLATTLVGDRLPSYFLASTIIILYMLQRPSPCVRLPATGGELPGHLDPPVPCLWPRAPFEVIVETLKAIIAFAAFAYYTLRAVKSVEPHIDGNSTAAASWKYILCPAGRVLCLWLSPVWADFAKLARQVVVDGASAWRLLQTDVWVSSLWSFLSCVTGVLSFVLMMIM